MADEKTDVLLIGPPKPVIVDGLARAFNLYRFSEVKDRETFFVDAAPRLRAIAVSATTERVDSDLMRRFPLLEIVSTFGVGYDHIDVLWAGEHGITLTNTPDVLTEEVADTALGLLLCTVREFPQAERYLRAGHWTREQLSPQQGDAAQPHGRDGRHGPYRPGDRAPARRHAGARGLSFSPAGGGRVLPALSQAHRHGARRGRAHGDHAGRRGNQEPHR